MKRRNRGQILVLFTLSLVVLIGMAALGVDVGYMYSVRHDLQRCADAGALAGASRFINAPGETGTWADAGVQAEATVRATDYASKDNVIQSRLLSQPGDNVIVTFDQGPDKIKVQTERTVPLFFARMFLGPTKRITAFAVAEAASVSTNTTCIAPFGVPIPWEEMGGDPFAFDNNSDVLHWDEFYGPGGGGAQAMDQQCEQLAAQYQPTGWSYQTHDNTSISTIRDAYLCPGTLLKLKIGPLSRQQNGWFRPLDLRPYAVDCPNNLMNSPAQLYEYLIINRNCGDTGCRVVINMNDPTQDLEVLTGDRVGPTIENIAPEYYSQFPGYPAENKINDYSLMDGRTEPNQIPDYGDDNYFDIPYADWVYSTNSPREGVTSRRIITVPIYDPRVPIDPGGTGSINPVAFAGFWIQDISPASPVEPGSEEKTATITARLIEVTGPGSGPGGQGGATVKTIRLVE